MGILKCFTGLWNKLNWVINLIYSFINPIYPDIVAVIKQVKDAGFENEAARTEAAKLINVILKKKNITMSDSLLNATIEIVYQLVKAGKA